MFLAFFLANIADYVNGYIKAKYYLKNESSSTCAKGIFKKVWYWVVICIAFFVSFVFKDMGDLLGINQELLHILLLYLVCFLFYIEK
ncbi:MAG: phage holin family protein [Lachnotalea sp.]